MSPFFLHSHLHKTYTLRRLAIVEGRLKKSLVNPEGKSFDSFNVRLLGYNFSR